MQKNNHKMAEERKENLSQMMVSKFLPYWPLLLLFSIIFLIGAFFYIRYYTTPLYEAKATLIIKDEKKGNEDSKLTESLDMISSKKIVENEIEVIQSRKLMDNVVKEYFLYAPIFEKGKVRVQSAYTISPVKVIAREPDSLKEFGKIEFTYDAKKQAVLLNRKYLCALNEFITTPYGVLKFIPNKTYQPSDIPGKQLYFSLTNPKGVAMSLLGGLSVAPSSKLSTVVNLSFIDEVPERAEDILNGLIKAYELSAILEKNSIAKNTLVFVEDRLNLVSKDLAAIEQKIQQYKSGSNAVDISAQGQLYLQSVNANDQKLNEVDMQLSVLNQVEKFAASNDNSGGAIVPSTLGVSDPTLSNLISSAYDAQQEYEKLKKTVGENNPKLVSLRDQMSKSRSSILNNIQSQRQGLTAQKQSLGISKGSYNSILQSVPQKERQLLDISREQNIKSSIYSFLLQKKEESALAYASAVSNSRVVDDAQAGSSPISPNKKLLYFIALVGAFGLWIGVITLKESFTGKILYRRELESLTTMPIVGEVAFNKSKKHVVVESGKRSSIAEEFRKLRTSLSFLGINATHKKILVTSSISGEGKSFIATNLAVSIALTGKKVVLVDLDLNVPTLSKVLGVNQEFGITDFLNGDKYPEEIIKQVEAHENLFFISAGSLPENPSELLLNGKVSEMIEYLDNSFDMVIIDTSPIVLITDAYILSDMCDATLYVVRHKYTPKSLVKRIDENNEINPIHNPAIVFNGVKERGLIKSKYGYGYNYVYGNYGNKESGSNNKKKVKS
ncbi:MAG: polysaccharide biosynthesis tyrosine autokinase [Ferruginibacter sp.]